jgi:WD40 repeat protein
VFAGHEFPVLSADVTRDGRLVATSDQGGVVRVWDGATGREVHAVRYSQEEVTCVRFSPDGRTLATIGADRAVRLWHVPTRRELFTLCRHDAPLRWVRFTSPTQLLVGADGREPGTSEVYAFPPPGD